MSVHGNSSLWVVADPHSIGLRSLLREHSLRCAVQKERAETDCSESQFPFHAQLHDRAIKKCAALANKTLLEILLVGLNLYLTMGEHSIAYTD